MDQTPAKEKEPVTTIGRVGKPVVTYVTTNDIPIHPSERLHLLDYEEVLKALRAGRVAVFDLPDGAWDDFVTWLRPELDADLDHDENFAEFRYDIEAHKLYVWSSEHSPWLLYSPEIFPGDLPLHPRDVKIILAERTAPV